MTTGRLRQFKCVTITIIEVELSRNIQHSLLFARRLRTLQVSEYAQYQLQLSDEGLEAAETFRLRRFRYFCSHLFSFVQFLI